MSNVLRELAQDGRITPVKGRETKCQELTKAKWPLAEQLLQNTRRLTASSGCCGLAAVVTWKMSQA